MSLHPDRILHNANILTMDARRPVASAIAIRRGLIEAVGNDSDVLALAGPATQREDVHGKTIVPGFHDCHLHLLWLGKILVSQVDLSGSQSIDEIGARLSDLAARSTGWIRGFGFDQDKVAERRFPTRADLDRISKTRPILISRVCGHAAVANSAAIALLSDDERRRGDLSSGLYTENAISAFHEKIPDPDDETLERALTTACELALSTGITSVQTMLDTPDQLRTYARLKNKLGRLPIRVVAMPPESAAETLFEHGIITGFGDDWLRVGGAKFFSDGSLGARTALLSTPYADDPNLIGQRIYPGRTLHERVKAVSRMGFQIVVHAIGDAALRDTIDAIEGALDGQDNRIARHRIEHASVCPPDQLDRLAQLRIVTTLQPQFVTSDTWTGQRLGPGRDRWAYPFASLVRSGVPVGLSSDSPVEKLNSFACLASAVNRHAWSPTETLTPQEALHAYTMGSAYCAHRETAVGSLEAGKHADFVVLSGSPLAEAFDANAQVLATFVAGEPVRSMSSFAAAL